MGICTSTCEEKKYSFKNERGDEKGMINLDSIVEFAPQVKTSICEIIIPNGGFGSGFFCKIPYTENDNLLLPVLITCNHVLNRDSIITKDVKIVIDGELKTIPLQQRKKWTDKDLDFTCIEIKEIEDNIHTFFNLDYIVLNYNYSNNCYLRKKVFIYGINENDKKIAFSNGLVKECRSNCFAYSCNTYPGCSGGSLLIRLIMVL